MNIERNEEYILLKYMDSNFTKYRCIITKEDVFVVNFCKRNLEKMERILQNYILEKFDNYYLLKVEEPVFLEYQLKNKFDEHMNIVLFTERLKKLEEDNQKLNDRIQRLEKITNELLFENRIFREYIPIIDKSVLNIQKEINEAIKIREDEKDRINKLFNQIRNNIENQIKKIEANEEKLEVQEEEKNQLKLRMTICESSVKNIKKITDENMLNILREIDNIYTIIDRSKLLILNKINEIFCKYEEKIIVLHPKKVFYKI